MILTCSGLTYCGWPLFLSLFYRARKKLVVAWIIQDSISLEGPMKNKVTLLTPNNTHRTASTEKGKKKNGRDEDLLGQSRT